MRGLFEGVTARGLVLELGAACVAMVVAWAALVLAFSF